MSEKNGAGRPKPDVAALRAEIKQTRAELGETVQALAARADVKARAKEQVELTKQKARAQVHDATGKVRDAAVAAVGAASEKVRTVTAQAGDKARETGALDKAHEAGVRMRRRPIPFAAMLAAGVALVGIILIVRGRRQ